MAATTSSAKTANLFSRLRQDYPDLLFDQSKQFYYSPPSTIHYDPAHPDFEQLILHELGHVVLKHQNYRQDIELITMETLAWDKARELSDQYQVNFDPDLAESRLDTYREWLYARSSCPTCNMTGYQTPDHIYHCPHCLTRWKAKVNRIRL